MSTTKTKPMKPNTHKTKSEAAVRCSELLDHGPVVGYVVITSRCNVVGYRLPPGCDKDDPALKPAIIAAENAARECFSELVNGVTRHARSVERSLAGIPDNS